MAILITELELWKIRVLSRNYESLDCAFWRQPGFGLVFCSSIMRLKLSGPADVQSPKVTVLHPFLRSLVMPATPFPPNVFYLEASGPPLTLPEAAYTDKAAVFKKGSHDNKTLQILKNA